VTLFGVFLTPVFYYMLERLAGETGPRGRPAVDEHTPGSKTAGVAQPLDGRAADWPVPVR